MRNKRHGVGMKTLILALAGMLCLMTACEKKDSGETIFVNKESLPEDTPWNHGTSAIMETEYGWYSTGAGEEMGLRYYEKGTGNTILLCNKPECEHDGGDQCEASYRNLKVVNACLYEGYMYVLGWEGVVNEFVTYEEDPDEVEVPDSLNLSLYRASLDGSSIDKVATIFETENTQHQRVNYSRRTFGALKYEHDDGSFIIHKGVAYVPLYLQLGGGSVGLRGAGLYRVDLSTGAVKEIEKYETLQSRTPSLLSGISDYVYYYRYDNDTRKQTWYRYVISEDRIEEADPKFADSKENEVFGKSFVDLGVPPVFTAERSYWLVRTHEEGQDGVLSILTVDAKTQQVLPEESFETQIPYNKKGYKFSPRNNGYYSLLLYDGKLVIGDVENIYFYDVKGNQAGEVAVPKEMLKWNDAEKQIRLEYKICNDKLYLIYGNSTDDFLGVGTAGYYRVLSCPLGDIFKSKGVWTDAYRIQGRKTWKEFLLDRESWFDRQILDGQPSYDEDPEMYEWCETVIRQHMEQLKQAYPEVFGEE
ncbi:MAG: hypothetical protein J6Z22_09870 [Lachnospiraceae bacterium]|nr:hypothetical protein [Lachnospiraceae bacterium]